MLEYVLIGKEGLQYLWSLEKKLGLKGGDELLLYLIDDRIVIERIGDPFKVLEEVLGDHSFTRNIREESLREASKAIRDRWRD